MFIGTHSTLSNIPFTQLWAESDCNICDNVLLVDTYGVSVMFNTVLKIIILEDKNIKYYPVSIMSIIIHLSMM